jgi:hypothetical protein
MTLLKTLYLHENLIEKIEGLEQNPDLDTINLSSNYVKKIENLAHLTKLNTLLLAKNRLKELDDVNGVLDVPSLCVLDIQDNCIEDAGVIQILEQMPNLSVLYLKGNPCVKQIKNYRKAIISKCPKLKYLDDRPVFDDERLRAEAFMNTLNETGNADAARQAELAEVERQREEKRAAEDRNHMLFQQMIDNARREHAERERSASLATVNANADVNIFSGDKIIPTNDPVLCRQYREDRWAASIGGRQSWEASSGDVAMYPEAWSFLGYRAPQSVLRERNGTLQELEATNVEFIGAKIPPLPSVNLFSSDEDQLPPPLESSAGKLDSFIPSLPQPPSITAEPTDVDSLD